LLPLNIYVEKRLHRGKKKSLPASQSSDSLAQSQLSSKESHVDITMMSNDGESVKYDMRRNSVASSSNSVSSISSPRHPSIPFSFMKFPLLWFLGNISNYYH
jgi:hypothetical protein